MLDLLTDWLYGGVYTDTYSSLDDGGLECYQQLSLSYHLVSSAFSLGFVGLLNWTLARPRLAAPLSKSSSGVPPSVLEKVTGVLLVICWLTQFAYKLLAKRLIFMLSPCHQVSLMQLYLCFSPVTQTSKRVLLVMSAWLYGPILALIAPAPGLLTFPGESFFFWYEHWLIAVIAPLAIVLGGRYHDLLKLGWVGELHGFWFFTLYQRVVLTATSLATWANIDYALCVPETFPAYPYLGLYYLLVADLIVIPLSLIGTYLLTGLNWALVRKSSKAVD